MPPIFLPTLDQGELQVPGSISPYRYGTVPPGKDDRHGRWANSEPTFI